MVAVTGALPTAVPQRWQNFAPGESSERQPAQAASATAAPQLEQNRPVTVAEQLGQVWAAVAGAGAGVGAGVGVGMRQK